MGNRKKSSSESKQKNSSKPHVKMSVSELHAILRAADDIISEGGAYAAG